MRRLFLLNARSNVRMSYATVIPTQGAKQRKDPMRRLFLLKERSNVMMSYATVIHTQEAKQPNDVPCDDYSNSSSEAT